VKSGFEASDHEAGGTAFICAASAPGSLWSARSRIVSNMEKRMMTHRFRLGQKVQLTGGFPRRFAAMGQYEIVRQLPNNGDEFQYRIKSTREPHERVVKESELEKA